MGLNQEKCLFQINELGYFREKIPLAQKNIAVKKFFLMKMWEASRAERSCFVHIFWCCVFYKCVYLSIWYAAYIHSFEFFFLTQSVSGEKNSLLLWIPLKIHSSLCFVILFYDVLLLYILKRCWYFLLPQFFSCSVLFPKRKLFYY